MAPVTYNRKLVDCVILDKDQTDPCIDTDPRMSVRGDYNAVASHYDSGKSTVGSDVMVAMIQLYCGRPLKVPRMSVRGDYNAVASHYDSGKSAVGSDVMVAMIQLYCGRPLKDMHILDAGGGTGSYVKDLIEYGVGHVTLLDASSGMLEQAKVKLSDAITKGSVDTVEAKLPPLPFPDARFDAVMFNLVLTHLDKVEDNDYPTCIEALKESSRVLRPGGVIVISTVLPSTFRDSIWFTQLNETLTERWCKTLPSMDQFEKMFQAADIECVQKMNVLGSELLKNYYYFEGPLDETWRRNYLYWLNATEEEISDVKEKIEDLKREGELEKWVKEHDHTDTAGLLTIMFCKPRK